MPATNRSWQAFGRSDKPGMQRSWLDTEDSCQLIGAHRGEFFVLVHEYKYMQQLIGSQHKSTSWTQKSHTEVWLVTHRNPINARAA